MKNERYHSRAMLMRATVTIILLAFMAYYGIMSVMGPGRRMAELNEQFITGKTENGEPGSGYYADSLYLRLVKEKSFYQSRIAMAETDSVYLTIIISDSLVNLEISGVVVHSAKIGEVRMSRMLKKGNDFAISSLLGAPLTIVNDFATIPKEPIMVKIAPKDTSEYKPDILPDTSNIEPVNFILKTDKGIKIYFYQMEAGRGDRLRLFWFDFRDRLRNFTGSLASIVRFRVPGYQPSIRIRLPKAQARIIYRALPRNGQIAVYL